MNKFVCIVMLLFAQCCFSQTKDAQLWENIYLSKKLNSSYSLTFNEEGRFRNNIAQFNYGYLDFGFLIKVTKNIKVSIDYNPVVTQSPKRDHWRQQGYIFIKYKIKPLKALETEFRVMFVKQYQDINSSETGNIPENYLRSKVVIKYSPYYYPWNKFTPYFATELYYNMDDNNKYGTQFDRLRYFLGSYYEINKRTAIELYYLIESNFNINNPPVNYVIGIGFEREL